MPPKKRKDDTPAAATPAAKKQPPASKPPAKPASPAAKPPAARTTSSARKAAARKRQVSTDDDSSSSSSSSGGSSGTSGTDDSAVMYESRAAAAAPESATPGMLAVAALFAGAQPRFEPCRLPTEDPELRSLFTRAVADVDGFEHEPPVLGRASHVVTEEHPGAIVSVLATGVAFPSIVRWAPRAYATPRTSEVYRLLLVAGTRTPTEYRSARDASSNPACPGSSWEEIAPERREDASARFTRVLQLHAVACPASPWSAKGKRRAAEPRPTTPSAGRDAAATATLAMPAALDVGSARAWAVRDVRWYGGCEGALACAATGAFDPTDRAAGRRGVFAAVTNAGHAALYALHDEVGVAAGGAEGGGSKGKEKAAEKRRREAARHVVLHPFAACQLPCETPATTCVFHVKPAEGRVALYVGLGDGDVAAASLLQHGAAPGKKAAPGCTIAFVMRVRMQQGPLSSLVVHTGWHVRHDDRVLLDRETLRPLGAAPTVSWPAAAAAAAAAPTPERPQWPARDRVTRQPAGRDIEENAVLLAGHCGEPIMALQVGAKGGRHVSEAVRVPKSMCGPMVSVPGGGVLVGGNDSTVKVEFPPESQLPVKDDLSKKKWPSNQLRSVCKWLYLFAHFAAGTSLTLSPLLYLQFYHTGTPQHEGVHHVQPLLRGGRQTAQRG